MSASQQKLIEQYARLLRAVHRQIVRTDRAIHTCGDELRLKGLLLRRHDLAVLRAETRRNLALEQDIASMMLPGAT